jgi:hypothetical protein
MPLNVTLTCVCGRQVAVNVALAGQCLRCQACGNSLQVPPMGIVAGVPVAGRTAPAVLSSARRPARTWPWLLCAALVLLATVGVVLSVRALSSPRERDNTERLAALADVKPVIPAEAKSNDPAAAEPTLEKRTAPTPAKTLDSPRPVEPKPAAPPSEKRGAAPLKRPKEAKPKEVFGPGLRLAWKLRQGDRLFQDLRVVQKPTFAVQGIPVASSLQYRVLSSFTVAKVEDDKLTVHQKVESAELLEADPLTQGLIVPLVLKLPGAMFTIELDTRMSVTRFAGTGGNPQMAGLKLPGLQGVQMAGLLDADGWKEMAQLTFFQPNRGLALGDKWSKPLTHNWGALGSWSGTTHYTYAGSKQSLHQVDYALQLTYKAPKAGGLIADALFQPVQAGGAIIFDRDKGRVVEAREHFRVRGRLSINLLGQNTGVDLQEDQLFSIRILDRQP